MRIVQFQVDPKDYAVFILMEDGRMFWNEGGIISPRWRAIELPEHPMGMPKEPLGRPPEERGLG